MAKKNNVHLQLSEELVGIDDELEKAMEALSSTNERIDLFLTEVSETGEINVNPEASSLEEAEEVESLAEEEVPQSSE